MKSAVRGPQEPRPRRTTYHSGIGMLSSGALVLGGVGLALAGEGDISTPIERYETGEITSNSAERMRADGTTGLRGVTAYYLPSGVKSSEQTFSHDVADGPYQTFYENGAVLLSMNFKGGLPHGASVYYHSSGVTRCQGAYELGFETGAWTCYHENGQLAAQGQFDAGDNRGRWSHFAPDGTPIGTGRENTP